MLIVPSFLNRPLDSVLLVPVRADVGDRASPSDPEYVCKVVTVKLVSSVLPTWVCLLHL